MCCLDNHIVPERSSRAFGAVLLLDQTATVGFTRLSQSGLAINILIDDGLHMIPLRSLIQVLERAQPEGATVCAKEGCGTGDGDIIRLSVLFSGMPGCRWVNVGINSGS